MEKVRIVISENPYKGTQQIVEITTHKNKKNRVGKPYKESRTRHIRVMPTKFRKENNE